MPERLRGLLPRLQSFSPRSTGYHVLTHVCTNTPALPGARMQSHRAGGELVQAGWPKWQGQSRALPSCSLCRTPTSFPGSPAPLHRADTGRGHSPSRCAAWSPAAPPAACSAGHRVRWNHLLSLTRPLPRYSCHKAPNATNPCTVSLTGVLFPASPLSLANS